MGLQEHVANQWSEQLIAAMADDHEPTSNNTLHAYVRTSTQSATRAELLLLLETANTPELSEPWDRVMREWAPAIPHDNDDDAAIDAFIGRLAADGLWLFESLEPSTLSPNLRHRIAERIIALVGQGHREGADESEHSSTPYMCMMGALLNFSAQDFSHDSLRSSRVSDVRICSR